MNQTENTLLFGIPDDLVMSTKDRLLLVADIIEAHPDNYDQKKWSHDTETDTVAFRPDELGGVTCGTHACVAGWALHCSPVHVRGTRDEHVPFDDVGAKQLGLSRTLGHWLFDESCEGDMVEALRLLAELPEPRTFAEASFMGIHSLLSSNPEDEDEDEDVDVSELLAERYFENKTRLGV